MALREPDRLFSHEDAQQANQCDQWRGWGADLDEPVSHSNDADWARADFSTDARVCSSAPLVSQKLRHLQAPPIRSG